MLGRGTYMKIKSLGDAKILKLDPYFSNCYSKKIKKLFDFRTKTFLKTKYVMNCVEN